jgi:hypothetical protein
MGFNRRKLEDQRREAVSFLNPPASVRIERRQPFSDGCPGAVNHRFR